MKGTILAVYTYVTAFSCFKLLCSGSLKETVVRRSLMSETCTGHLVLRVLRSTRVRLCQKTPTCHVPKPTYRSSGVSNLLDMHVTYSETQNCRLLFTSRLIPAVTRLTPIRNVSGSNLGQGSMLVVVPPDELEPWPLWLPWMYLLLGVLSVSLMKQWFVS